MIIDSSNSVETLKCKKILANYLLYIAKIPLFYKDKDFYYFAKTKSLESVLINLPFYLKILRV